VYLSGIGNSEHQQENCRPCNIYIYIYIYIYITEEYSDMLIAFLCIFI